MQCFVWLTSILTPYQRNSMVSEKSVFPKKACSDISRLILSRIFTSDPNPTALSEVYRLFTTKVYLYVRVASFDAIFDCIVNMIGRLFNLHIVKSTPNNQTWKRQGFLIFILTLTSHLRYHMFSSCSVKCSVKMTFGYFITCYKYSIRNFQKRFHQTVI